jgi:hypothetical protein
MSDISTEAVGVQAIDSAITPRAAHDSPADTTDVLHQEAGPAPGQRQAQPVASAAMGPVASGQLLAGFDLDSLRLSQNFGETLGVKRLITRVPVRKPHKSEFFRVRPGEAWQFPTAILERPQESETFLLVPEVVQVIPELVRPVVLHTAIDRTNNVFLIPVPLPGPDGRRNPWHDSLAQIVAKAETRWLRGVANMALGAYDMLVAQGNLDEPEWPDLSLRDLLEIAFRDRVITAANHPVISQLRGIS